MCSSDIIYVRGLGDYEFSWKGIFTHGKASFKGVKVWLTEKGGIRYDQAFDGWSIQPDLIHQKALRHRHALSIYGGYLYCLYGATPIRCVREWLNPMSPIDLIKDLKQIECSGYPLPVGLENLNGNIYVEKGWGRLIWYNIYNITGIEKELLEIEEMAIKSGIIFND